MLFHKPEDGGFNTEAINAIPVDVLTASLGEGMLRLGDIAEATV
jgi:hypothetical protein